MERTGYVWRPSQRPVEVTACPSLDEPLSQMATQAQMESDIFLRWVARIQHAPMLHRKLWEFVYILQALDTAGCLAPGKKGIGFGVGKEPLSAVMADRGCQVLATDLPADDAAIAHWSSSNQHAAALDDLNQLGLCDPATFHARVRFRPVDMNHLPNDLGEFDFTWSGCAMDHLGTIERGLDFVHESLKCLKPGGIAVHTTEYNTDSNTATLTAGDVVIYRRRDFERLAAALIADGHEIVLNFTPGDKEFDRRIVRSPYDDPCHIRIDIGGWATTSFGMIIRKKGGDTPYSPLAAAERARAQAAARKPEPPPKQVPPVVVQAQPSMTRLISQVVTVAQMETPVYARWLREMHLPFAFHRKTWEFAYILQALEECGNLGPGRRGLGFGVGKEPLAAVLAAYGCEIVATDLPAADAAARQWSPSNQHAGALADLNETDRCDPEQFRRLVSFRPVDMNRIPADLAGFDFTWSSCALEHLGTLEKGAAFVKNSLRCLKPGGVAVHTTELNIADLERTLTHGPVAVFRRKDIEALAGQLLAEGHEIALNFTMGDTAMDRAVSEPPYMAGNVIKIRYEVPHCVGTSIGLIVRKKGGDSPYSPLQIAAEIARAAETERRATMTAGLKHWIRRIPVLGGAAAWVWSALKAPGRVQALEARWEEALTVKREMADETGKHTPGSAYLGDHLALARVQGLKMFLDTRDMSLSPHLLLDGEWESWITTAFIEAARPGMTVVDVGANIGYYTLLAARGVGPDGSVWAFEPEPDNVALLRKSIEINGFTDRTRVVAKALSSQPGTADLFLAPGMYQASPSIFPGMVDDFTGRITVETARLDDELPPGTRVDLVKLDAEGAEPLIFKGMRRVLAENRGIVLIMEFCPDHFRRAELDGHAFLTDIVTEGFLLRRIATTGAIEPVTEQQVMGPGYQTLYLRRGI